jgi:MiaB/RimO family radical SAM methylthiotransferase
MNNSNETPLRVYISTNGCVCAQLSTKCLRDFLEINKITQTKKVDQADLVLFYGCGLTESNETNTLKIIKNLKNNMKASAKIVIWGCLPKQNPGSLSTIYDGPTIGPLDFQVFEEMFGDNISFKDLNFSSSNEELKTCREPLMSYTEANVDPVTNTISLLQEGYKKVSDKIKKITTPYYILVATGCTGKCTYCSEKPVFGEIKSRFMEEILAEFKIGLQLGYNRFSFLATDLGAYGMDINTNLGELLRKIMSTNNTQNYRLILNQIEPHNLIEVYPDLEEIFSSGKVEELMSPVQSASNRILKLMGRKYTIEEWKDCMLKIHNKFPNIRLSTHFLVGFPTETGEDFDKTKALLDHLPFLNDITVFKYSSRPTVRSKDMPEQIPEEIKEFRKKELIRKFKRKRTILL